MDWFPYDLDLRHERVNHNNFMRNCAPGDMTYFVYMKKAVKLNNKYIIIKLTMTEQKVKNNMLIIRTPSSFRKYTF